MSELFDGLNIAELVEEHDRLERGNSNSFLENFVILPKEGSLTIRLLPPAKGKRFYCETRLHRFLFPNGQKKNIHCTRTLQRVGKDKRWLDVNPKDPCPVCKYYSELWAKSDILEKAGDKRRADELRTQARAIKPQPRYYYNCIVRQQINSKTNELEKNIGPLIYSAPQQTHSIVITNILGDPKAEKPIQSLGDVTDVKTGRDFKVVIKKNKASGFPDYGDSWFLDQSPLGDQDQVNKWLSKLHDLDSYRRLISHEEMTIILKKYLGILPMDNNDESASEKESLVGSSVGLENKVEEVVSRKKSSVVSQLEESMGGSGNDDESLDDDEFFAELENM